MESGASWAFRLLHFIQKEIHLPWLYIYFLCIIVLKSTDISFITIFVYCMLGWAYSKKDRGAIEILAIFK